MQTGWPHLMSVTSCLCCAPAVAICSALIGLDGSNATKQLFSPSRRFGARFGPYVQADSSFVASLLDGQNPKQCETLIQSVLQYAASLMMKTWKSSVRESITQ